MVEFSQLNLYQKINYVLLYLQAFLGLMGITSNIVTICVLSRKRLRNNSYSFYSRIMALNDIFVLAYTFRNWASFVFDANLNLTAPFFCAFDDFALNSSFLASLWLLTLISADRLYSIVFPNRFKLFKNRVCQSFLVLFVFVYSCSTHIGLPLKSRLVTIPAFNQSTTLLINSSDSSLQSGLVEICYVPSYVLTITSFVSLINLFLVNVVINNTLNMRIIFLIYSSHKIAASEFQQRVQKSCTLTDRRFALSSVSLNLCSLVLKMPYAIVTLVFYYQSSFLSPDLVQLTITGTITLSLFQNGMSLLVNMLTNKIFYSEFFYMLGLKRSILTITDSNIITRQKIFDSFV